MQLYGRTLCVIFDFKRNPVAGGNEYQETALLIITNGYIATFVIDVFGFVCPETGMIFLSVHN